MINLVVYLALLFGGSPAHAVDTCAYIHTGAGLECIGKDPDVNIRKSLAREYDAVRSAAGGSGS